MYHFTPFCSGRRTNRQMATKEPNSVERPTQLGEHLTPGYGRFLFSAVQSSLDFGTEFPDDIYRRRNTHRDIGLANAISGCSVFSLIPLRREHGSAIDSGQTRNIRVDMCVVSVSENRSARGVQGAMKSSAARAVKIT